MSAASPGTSLTTHHKEHVPCARIHVKPLCLDFWTDASLTSEMIPLA